jgi:hypothetical protein
MYNDIDYAKEALFARSSFGSTLDILQPSGGEHRIEAMIVRTNGRIGIRRLDVYD